MTPEGSTDAPLAHVLIPAYGRADYLRLTLASTKPIIDTGWPVTVVDDATPDDSIRAVAEEIPGVTYIRNDTQLGVAGNFNQCRDLSQGRYTVLLGSDDILLPEYPEILKSIVSHFGETEMLQSGVTTIGGDGRQSTPLADRVKRWIAPHIPHPGRVLSGETLATSILIGNWLYFPAIAWRTDVLHRYPFDERLSSAMDLEVILKIVFDGGRIAVSKSAGLLYRRHDASVSSIAINQHRFDEELALSAWARAVASEKGWKKAAAAAAMSPTVRAHKALATLTR